MQVVSEIQCYARPVLWCCLCGADWGNCDGLVWGDHPFVVWGYSFNCWEANHCPGERGGRGPLPGVPCETACRVGSDCRGRRVRLFLVLVGYRAHL